LYFDDFTVLRDDAECSVRTVEPFLALMGLEDRNYWVEWLEHERHQAQTCKKE